MNGLIPLDDFEAALAHLYSEKVSSSSSQRSNAADDSAFTATDQRRADQCAIERAGKSVNSWSIAGDRSFKRSAAKERPTRSGSPIVGPAKLPPELIFHIALLLSSECAPSTPSWHLAVWPAAAWTNSDGTAVVSAGQAGESMAPSARRVLRTLIGLSALSTGLRRLISPLVWERIDISYPSRLPSLHALLSYYSHAQSSKSHDRLVSPLTHVRRMHLSLPSRYSSVDQESLLSLLNGGVRSDLLREFIFEAGEPPSGSLLRALLPTSQRAKADKRVKAQKIAAERLRSTSEGNKSGITTTFGPTGLRQIRVRSEMSDEVRQWEREARPGAYPALAVTSVKSESTSAFENGETISDGSVKTVGSEEEEDDSSPTYGLTALSMSCSIFWPGHALMSSFRNIQHLRLTSYEAHLLPQHLPAMLLALTKPLKSLSMSTSKTAVLHVRELIDLGVWRGLESLDVYAVTPEPPLAEALRSARKTLKHLRLTLDINGAFGNYDRLWRDLTKRQEAIRDSEDGKHAHEHEHKHKHKHKHKHDHPHEDDDEGLPALQVLQVDPFPQQHTSPSFPDFVRACPSLRLINGRDADRLRLNGFELLDPDHYTGALAY
ncbi:hypothetical protein IE81DRAFT_113981 [Ceraceosorus guamensis]|uniref:Uncharacterized protein n=1 Tax=Ceraceosorus guamensis TaxID=1522189 RepID=A0A316VZ67_9BASI|nr:hypothetical protein IE81DRAFT_113981 [Ceraceosorus guamensis]PWN42752.1 hypothetical protein IE81DRAFT_113981 [Ceraceosorus guamensis]